MLEERDTQQKNHADRHVRAGLVNLGVAQKLDMVHASPGSEHLLWLPDLVCSRLCP